MQGTHREVDCLAMGPALAVLGLVESGKHMVGAVVGLPLDLPERSVCPPSSSFFLSGWATNTLLCPCLFMQNLAHGGRVCAIRSQESMYGN